MAVFKGLSVKEAEERIQKYGYNEIKEISKVSAFKILLRQVKNNFVIYLLVVAMILSFIVGKGITSYTILAVIVMVAGVGFFQEYKSEKAIATLRKMIMPLSTVIRGGKEIEIPSREVVLGDIILIKTGEKIATDCVVLESVDLRVNEAVLTGESIDVEKSSEDTKNKIYMGTLVVNGRCIARVTNIGMNTEFGKITKMISVAEKELPLQKKINHVTKYMVIIALTVSILTGFVMLVRNAPLSSEMLIEILIIVIALSVSAFPEGFPVVLMTTLASGAYRMAQKNAIVNRMSIIETLGETTVICSDKTGTITSGEMTVKKIFCDGKDYLISGSGYEASGEISSGDIKVDLLKNKTLETLLKAGVLCNDSRIDFIKDEGKYLASGTPTESALLVASSKTSILKENIDFSREGEIPFSSDRKIMSVKIKEGKKHYVYSKGAPEIILNKCNFIKRDNGVFRLTKRDKESILEKNRIFTSVAFRTLGIAYKEVDMKSTKDSYENELVFLGLVGMEDPPRDEVMDAIKLCYDAGIQVKMITGDNKETAVAIANQINLRKGAIFLGEELDKFTDKELCRVVKTAVIFARVKPEHKLRIVRALKENGEIVTMTGDGVNDAPSLKEAHIGVAMGIGGTDVTREVADLTLRDDNFSTIVSAIKEGRTIFNNIQKFVTYQLSCNTAELMIVFIGILIGLPLPLLAIHILFMNLVTDNLPAITLGFNSSSTDVMYAKPRIKPHILNKELIRLFLVVGAMMAFITLGVFYFTYEILGQDIADARTTALATLIFVEIANAFNFRSFRKGVLNRSPFKNKYLVYASLISILATLAIIYTPLNKLFETVSVGWLDFVVAVVTSFLVIVVLDIWKFKRGSLDS